MSIAGEVIEALAEDLEVNAGLPEHGLVRYFRPRIILPSDCPLLVVHYLDKVVEPDTTVWFGAFMRVGCSWHVATVEEVETLQENEGAFQNVLTAVEAIEARVRLLSVRGLVTPSEKAWELLPSQTRPEPPEMQTGATQGIVHEVVVRLTETGAE